MLVGTAVVENLGVELGSGMDSAKQDVSWTRGWHVEGTHATLE